MAPKEIEVTDKIIKGTGRVLSKVRVHLIFWGKRWSGREMDDITNAATTILDPRGYLSGIAEYNNREPVDAVLSPSIQVDQDPATPFNDPADIEAEITNLIENKTVDPDPASDPEHRDQLYIVVLPDTAIPVASGVEPRGGAHSCFRHNGKPVYYGWVRGGAVGDRLPRITVALSEELVEAITDPEPFTGWVSSDRREMCDVCEGVNALVDGVVVRTYYSNAVQDCIPRPPAKK